MKKNILLILFIIISSNLFSQTDYFYGNRTYCTKPSDEHSLKIFDLGLECIRNNIYLGSAAEIFQDLIKKDSTFCDAYFLAGYTFRMSDMNKEAFAFYYIADSLAQNRSIEFKQNLATVSMIVGADDFSRKKFEELKQYFPNSPEGYYGVALTSTIMGDVDYGLENIDIAEKKYASSHPDSQFLKAVLLTLNQKHKESLPYYEKVIGKFKKDDNFNGNYALSLYEVGILNNDEKMLKKAKSHYKKVKDKSDLTDYIKEKFE